MKLIGKVCLVTGGVSGLGRATAERLMGVGAQVVIADVHADKGTQVADALGDRCRFVECDVCDDDRVAHAVREAAAWGEVRVLVHCAGGGSPLRVLEPDGEPGDLETFRAALELNVVSAFNLLRRTCSVMATNRLDEGERGVCVLTSSIAAFEGQSAQLGYAAAKAAIVGLTLPAARDLSRHAIRVCAIAPGIFDTGMLRGLSDETRSRMERTLPHPRRFGHPDEFGRAVMSIIDNPMMNGECVRLDGALRLAGIDTAWGTELADEVGNPRTDQL
jgi:NAD(P)-dependent dehydrogenase (short-subunit alcohol dehydrogenase family)